MHPSPEDTRAMTGAEGWAAILRFWFDECTPTQWWSAEPAFDDELRRRFALVHQAAARGELAGWRGTPQGRLAEVIVLDQFSRNLHRGTPLAFACDLGALVLAQEAIAAGHDRALVPEQRLFLYMPFMHSESPAVHDTAVALFEDLGLASNLEYERRHKAIVDRFGRYPHRNAILGRPSTPEELHFLTQPGSRF